jgi:hypothetical protein
MFIEIGALLTWILQLYELVDFNCVIVDWVVG